MFLKIGALKNFANFTVRHLGWDLFLIKFFYRLPSVAAFIYLAFHECFFFNFSLAHFHYFLTVLLLPSFEEILSSLCHYYYMINITIAKWFIRINENATTYCSAISMIVKCISALMQFILKQATKKPINKVQRKNIFSFRLVISLICQDCLISPNSVLSLAKQTQIY